MGYKYIVANDMIASVNDENQVVEHLEKIPMLVESMKYENEVLVIHTRYLSKTFHNEVKCLMISGKRTMEPETDIGSGEVRFCFQMKVPELEVPGIKFVIEYENQRLELKKQILHNNQIKLGKYNVRIVNQKFKLFSLTENIIYMAKALLKKVKHS